MIILADDCLVFQTASGEGIPCSAEMISVELMGESANLFDAEFIKHAAAAVFHYFRDELGRDTVSVAEFSLALERVLRGFNLPPKAADLTDEAQPRVVSSDLRQLYAEAGKGCELTFFPRLRDELRIKLQESPQTLCFQGLRDCAKLMAGAQRWSHRCQHIQDQIVDFLRSCMFREHAGVSCALVVK